MLHSRSNYWSPNNSAWSQANESLTSNVINQEVRLYVGETGEVRVETRYSRESFAPQEFVAYLRRELARLRDNNPEDSGSSKVTIQAKNIFSVLLVLLICPMLFIGCTAKSESADNSAAQKIVTVGGSVTEIVYALNAENRIVGADTSSLYPAAATKLPQVGYQRQLSGEGVVSLKPTLVITLPETGPPAALDQIKSAGIQVTTVNGDHNIEGAKAKIRQIAQILKLEPRGEAIINSLDNDLSEAAKIVAASQSKPKVLFIYARGAGAANVGGLGTAGDEMIRLAGGVNAVAEFENYKPLTPEALVTAEPDIILLPQLGLDSLGGVAGVLNLPGVAETPAGKNKRIVAIDDLMLLGFGPRTGAAVKELCQKLHQAEPSH